MSPHVFEVDQPTKFHYKMPINAVSSIANRVTGFALTASALLRLVTWTRMLQACRVPASNHEAVGMHTRETLRRLCMEHACTRRKKKSILLAAAL